MVNINEVLLRAVALMQETALNSINPDRVGGIMRDTLLALNDLWLQQGAALVISKIYASVAQMEADTAPVSDLTGLPLRPGQIVVIASSDGDNGVVYRYNGTEAPSWSAIGQIGSNSPVDNLISDSSVRPLAARQGKVLDGKITRLEQKVDDIVTGKYYGYFATAADLPEDASVDGFAYVGSGPTYTIYNCEGGVWTSSGIVVNQSPVGNGEDIDQNAEGKLQFANRPNTDGMGYVILRKDKTFAEQVTEENTIYEIRYDFTLDENVTIPNNCVLKFNGGSVSNGNITFTDTMLDGVIKLRNNSYSGTLINDEAHINWFAEPNTNVSNILSFLTVTCRHIIIDAGIWLIDKYIKIYSDTTIEGVNPNTSVLKINTIDYTGTFNVVFGSTDTPITDKYQFTHDASGQTKYTQEEIDAFLSTTLIENVLIKNIHFDKVDHSRLVYCAQFNQADNCNVVNCSFAYPAGDATHLLNLGGSIMYFFSKNCIVDNCEAHDDVLITLDYCVYCTVQNNTVLRARATCIESRYGSDLFIINNYVKDNYGPESTVGINSAHCRIERNVVYVTGDDGMPTNSFSCITTNHEDATGNTGDGFIIRGNRLIKEGGTCALLVQGGKNHIIEDNYIVAKNTAQYALYCIGGLYKTITIKNNIINAAVNGIFVRADSGYPAIENVLLEGNNIDCVDKAIDLHNIKCTIINDNSIKGDLVSTNPAIATGSSKKCIITNNNIANYKAAFSFTADVDSCIISNNILTNVAFAYNYLKHFIFINNYIELENVDNFLIVGTILGVFVVENNYIKADANFLNFIYLLQGCITNDTKINLISIANNYTGTVNEINGDTSGLSSLKGAAYAFLLGRKTPEIKLLQVPIWSNPNLDFSDSPMTDNMLYLDRKHKTLGYSENNKLVSVADGLKVANKIGTTSERPTLDASDAGFQYFDKTLGKPIYWTGTTWVDATGAQV